MTRHFLSQNTKAQRNLKGDRKYTMDNRVAIVTGGASGIGRAIGLRLAREGIAIGVADINLAQAIVIAEEIERAGGQALPVQVDVSKPAQIYAMVDQVVAAFGKLDIMVANAGVSRALPMQEVTEAFYDWMTSINIKGVFFCDQAAGLQMIKQGHGGKIINAASISGRKGSAYQSVYCATKFAVIGLTQSFAAELAPHQVTVNAYCPGIVETPLWTTLDQDFADIPGTARLSERISGIPLGRVQRPEDVAGLVAFLVSPDADYITGQSYIQDGGKLMY